MAGDKVQSAHTGKSYEVMDIGIMYPEETPTGALYAWRAIFLFL
jgi:GTP-binding protein LepA